MIDKLSDIFLEQADLNSRIVTERGLEFTQNDWMLKWTLALFSETSEVLDELNWKHWKNEKSVDWENVKGEVVDLLHFVISMALTCGMNADELHYRYMEKNAENHARQEGLVKGREDYKPKEV